MGGIFIKVLNLIRTGKVLVSNHGYDEMMHDNILFKDAIVKVAEGIVIEEYPGYHKGPCALVLQRDLSGRPIHVVWGVPRNGPALAVLVTAYRPDPERWELDLVRRKT